MKTNILFTCILILILFSCTKPFEDNDLPQRQLKSIVFEGQADSIGIRHPVSMDFYYDQNKKLDVIIAKGVFETREFKYHYNSNGSLEKIVRVGSLDTTQKQVSKYEYEQGNLVSVTRYSTSGLYSSKGDLEYDMGRITRYTKYSKVNSALQAEEKYLFQYDRRGNMVQQEIFFSNDEEGFDWVKTFEFSYDNKKNPLKGYHLFEGMEPILLNTPLLYNSNNVCEWTLKEGSRADSWDIDYTYEKGYPVKGTVPGNESLNRTYSYY